MRINFNTASIPREAAKRLKKQLSIKHSKALEWTAFVLGYRNWYELCAQLGHETASALDESCGPDELKLRLEYQESRLLTCLAREPDVGASVSAGSILAEWRPSAARPRKHAKGLNSTDPADSR